MNRRFTRVLAEQAKHVTAVDFIEKFTLKNQELNAAFNNITFVTNDATKLAYESNTYATEINFFFFVYFEIH